MPLTLKDIEDYDRKDMLRVEHIHWAITNEVRDLKNWENALTLLTSYLAPVVLASEKAVAAAATAAAANPTAATGDSNNADKKATANTKSPTVAVVGGGGRGQPKALTSKFSDFVEDEVTGQFTKQVNEEDVRMIQYSVAALVRYAPTPSDSNVVYMFYLQRQPPVRNDETIDNCLISLIYQYAQVKDDLELRAKGLDLIKVALERGVGLSSYKSRTSVKNQNYRQQKETILASVSRPILIQQGLQITEDGRALEARRPNSQYQQGRPFTQQRQQQQQQQQGSQSFHKGSNGFSAGGQRQGQGQGQNQAQAQGQGQGQVVSGRKSGRSAGSSPQPQSQQPQQVPQQTQTQGNTKPRHRKQDSPRLANEDAQDTNSNTTTSTSSRQEESLDQYEYYTKASRSFSGTERVSKFGSRPAFGGVGSGSSNGGRLRTIAFVPASNNPMLKTDHPAPSSTEEDSSPAGDDAVAKDDVTAVLTEGVEKLRLDQETD